MSSAGRLRTEGVPIITTGSLKPRKNGNPRMPIFTGCVYFHDNGSVFMSSEFTDFVKRNGIRHVTSSPYHPSSNGLAERAVQTMKDGLKKLVSGSLETKLARFLFKYRLTPQTVTGVSPAELMFGRPLRS